MLTMITTEEYRELVLGEEERNRLLEELRYTEEKLQETQKALDDLLLMLTKGETIPEYPDGFKSFNIELDNTIAKYINEHFVTERKLNISNTEVTENE